MPNDREGSKPDPEEEEGGGPVKTFLEHLEDLRWTLVKVVSAILIGMVVCLVAGNRLVGLLTWPLERAQALRPVGDPWVRAVFGSNVVGRLDTRMLPAEFGGTNAPRTVDIRMAPFVTASSTNYFLAAVPGQVETRESFNQRMVTLKNYSPIGAFIVALQLALYGGLTLSAPFVIFFIGQFVMPALHVHEKSFVYRAAGMGSILFVMGVAFCYFLIMQVAIVATVEFSKWMGFGADEWRAEDYIGFVCKFMLGMGLCFELPVVLLALVKVGLINYQTLSKYRAYWVVIELGISAIVTPSGDPFTMVLMAIPIHALYEVSTFIAWIWYQRDKRNALTKDG